MKKWIVFFFLAGCSSQGELVLPDGSRGYLVKCAGTECMVKSGEVCPRGYDILNLDSRNGWVNVRNYDAFPEPRELIVRCK